MHIETVTGGSRPKFAAPLGPMRSAIDGLTSAENRT
jgi:hypothetical protein